MRGGALSRETHFQAAAGQAQPHCPNAKGKRAAPRAAGAAPWGTGEVFRGLSSLCFNYQIRQKLGSFDHRQEPAASWPKPRHRLALNCRSVGAIATQMLPSASSSLPPLLYSSQTWPVVQNGRMSDEQFLSGSSVSHSYLHPCLVSENTISFSSSSTLSGQISVNLKLKC